MSACTIFRNFVVPVEDKSLIIISKWIESDKFKPEVDHIRDLIAAGKNEEAQQKKQQLLAFTPSAIFREKRLLTHIERYTGFIHLDFDKLSPDQLQSAFNTIIAIPYTFLCFRSPSGNGLKVFVEVNTGQEDHSLAYSQITELYESATDLKSDEKCKDITRLCFMSHDPQLYKNLKYKKFEVKKAITVQSEMPAESEPTRQPSNQVSKDLITENGYEEGFRRCIGFTEQKKTYTEGSRNDFIYALASNCNRLGIPQDIACGFAMDQFDLTRREITASFKSAYSHHSAEFAKFARFAKVANSTKEDEATLEDLLKNTPSIPQELYVQMPDLLKSGSMAFTEFREKDVFLTGALAILSGCLPGVKGVYAGQEVFPNIFSFTVAPAASGKGALKFAKMLADEYHNAVLTDSREAEGRYNQEVADHKQRQIKKKADTPHEDPPVKPAFKVVYIPANTSYAKILWHLEQNDGNGVICETEADTLGNVFKQEWGSYSDMLRKSFHHERISSSRKTNNEFTEVNNPSLSIALSGTPNQVTGLIASAEDGLFSRFIFYAFKVEQRWKDVSPGANNINLTDHFKKLSQNVHQMVEFLQREETIIQLTPEQWQHLNQQCEEWLNEVTMFTAEEAASIVKRLGLILYRICMLFSALRKFENAESAKSVYCTNEDFNIARQLVEIYLHHSILMFNNLPKQAESTKFKNGDNKRNFVEALPNEFTRKQAVEIGKQFYLGESTVSHLLPKLVPQFLSQPKTGYYIKNPVSIR